MSQDPAAQFSAAVLAYGQARTPEAISAANAALKALTPAGLYLRPDNRKIPTVVNVHTLDDIGASFATLYLARPRMRAHDPNLVALAWGVIQGAGAVVNMPKLGQFERSKLAGYDVEPNGFSAGGWIARDPEGEEIPAFMRVPVRGEATPNHATERAAWEACDRHRMFGSAADLAEASEGFTCDGCGRPEADCSADPCEAVQQDREG